MNTYFNEPYPKIQVERKNMELAKLLSHSYASNESELTEIHLYLYQSMVLKEEYSEISKILEEIGKVEMHHLYLLGQTINLLGCNPIYADCNFNMVNYWNGYDVYYDTDIHTIIEIDIESEKKAIYDYQMLLVNIDDIYVKNLIKRIIKDEEVHLEVFTKLSQILS